MPENARGPNTTRPPGMGEGMDKVNGTTDKGAEGEPRKKRKKAGSAEDGDESGEKGKRPCDMCRKRKVSRMSRPMSDPI